MAGREGPASGAPTRKRTSQMHGSGRQVAPASILWHVSARPYLDGGDSFSITWSRPKLAAF